MTPSGMTEWDDDQTLQDYLDGELSATEVIFLEKRLCLESDLADRLIELACDDSVLAEWGAPDVFGKWSVPSKGFRLGKPSLKLLLPRKFSGTAVLFTVMTVVWSSAILFGYHLYISSTTAQQMNVAGKVARQHKQQTITEGSVELILPTGVKVFITAPATFQVTGENEINLSRGMLLANVATEAGMGFTVNTPSGSIVDLGTIFGVEVDELGASGVQVFKGRVELASFSGDKTTLLTGNAMRCESANRQWQKTRKLSDNFYTDFQEISDIDIHHQKAPVLVAHWKLNEEQGATIAKDLSENQLHLNIMPNEGISPFTGLAGPSGSSTAAGPFLKQIHQLRRVLTKTEVEKFDVTSFTIEMWARNSSAKNKKNAAVLFHYRNTNKNSQFNFYTSETSNSLNVGYITTDGIYVVHASSGQLKWEKDRWYHIVFTYDANSSALHDSIITITRTPEGETDPDFSQTFSGTKDMSSFVANGILVVGGCTHPSVPWYWGGDIDNVKFFNGIPKKYLIAQDK